jgi:peptide/nickel transport system permease protein
VLDRLINCCLCRHLDTGVLLALMLIYLFAVRLGWLPAGRTPSVGQRWRGRHREIPGPPVRPLRRPGVHAFTRASMVEVMRMDYIRTARQSAGKMRVVFARRAMP